MATSSASTSPLRAWDLCPGTREKPIQIFAREADIPSEFSTDPAHYRSRVWKAAYEGLVAGFGFGMFTHNLSPQDYKQILDAIEFDEKAGDKKTTLATMQGPSCIKDNYKGLEEPGLLIKFATRENFSKMLEMLIISQQWILSFVLQRGLTEVVFGPNTPKRPKPDLLEIVTSVSCRFKVILQPMGGMVDHLRLIDGDLRMFQVEERESFIVSRENIFPSEGRTVCDSGWPRNAKQSCEDKDTGSYMVLTLFADMDTDFEDEDMEPKDYGIYVTVTENIIRGFTGKKHERGRYFEYVGPINPMDEMTSRTYYMTPGSSLVLPSHFAVRVGGPVYSPVHLFGYLVRVLRVAEHGKMDFLYRNDLQLYDELDEYSAHTEYTLQDTFQFVKWSTDRPTSRKSRTGVVGTIPSILKIPINTPERERMVQPFYDVTNGPVSMDSVYTRNPILKLVKHTEGIVYDDDAGEPEQRMWIGNRTQWSITNVPYIFLNKLTGGGICFPYDIQKN